MESINVTLNPNDMGSGITLSNGNLTVTTASNNNSIRATHGKILGKWYWEVKLSNGVDSTIGISNKSFSMISSEINTSNNWRVYNVAGGRKFPENTTYGTPSTVGNTIGVALDLDNGTLEFYKNGISMGISHANVKELGEVYPTLRFYSNTSQTMNINFGATSFTYNIPHGFMPYAMYPSHKILLSSNESKIKGIKKGAIDDSNAIPPMTSNIAPSGVASASSIYSSTYDVWKAFDIDDTGTSYWRSANNTVYPVYLEYEFPTPIRIGRYGLIGVTSVLPKEWTFEGSNDGVSWVILDERTVTLTALVLTTFDLVKAGLFKKYRLNIRSSGITTGISAFKMYEQSTDIVVNLPSHNEIDFFNYGVDLDSSLFSENYSSTINIVSENASLDTGKIFEHTVDLSKRRVDKIILN
ncbi:SPRY domain-containing protein [Paenibacillus fonticola]|uniref:SPRY domain-containing protein n=1 Tax=Paenibacillus fonticola TaxID=379896 RepID=UPI000361E67D|nr:SPRY domain-containing protein [Paenibacillus fonticola]